MKPTTFFSLFASLAMASSSLSSTTSLSKRADEGVYCYSVTHLAGFSALCPPSSWPIENDRGLNVMGVFYFALATTSLPDDTVYQAQENIICTVTKPTPNITASVNANAALALPKGPSGNAGGSVTFSFHLPNTGDNSICMFTEGEHDKAAAPNITLGQARQRLYTLITAPNQNCETCGQIRIQPDSSPTNSSDPGAILKMDVRGANNCIGKCVGPNSFSSDARASPSPSPSSSAGRQVLPVGAWILQTALASAGIAWAIGIVVFGVMVA